MGDDATGSDGGDASTGDAPAASVDTTYLDLYLQQGVFIDPFYPDALGGDINFVEPACTQAVSNLASFGAARGDVDANAVLASLQAISADVPSDFEPALRAWEGFIADHSGTYSGPFFAASQGARDDDAIRTTLTDPDVIRMLDAHQALRLVPPEDFVGFLNASCTPLEIGVAITTTE